MYRRHLSLCSSFSGSITLTSSSQIMYLIVLITQKLYLLSSVFFFCFVRWNKKPWLILSSFCVSLIQFNSHSMNLKFKRLIIVKRILRLLLYMFEMSMIIHRFLIKHHIVHKSRKKMIVDCRKKLLRWVLLYFYLKLQTRNIWEHQKHYDLVNLVHQGVYKTLFV